MAWDFDDKRPVYLQISEMIKDMIFKGQYTAGDRLPSVRELSVEAAVNPNTMQRALGDLEREGYICTERTSGKYITSDGDFLKMKKRQYAADLIRGSVEKLIELGMSKNDIKTLITDIFEGGVKDECAEMQ